MNNTDSAQPLIGQIHSVLSSDWLLLSGPRPLMITTLMTFLRSLNNEGQEERYREAQTGGDGSLERGEPLLASGGKWYPAAFLKEDNVQPVCWVFVFS